MAHGNKSWYPTAADAADMAGETQTEQSVGLGNTASYQSSGVPVMVHLRGGVANLEAVEFNFVTKAITFAESSGPCTISFDGGVTTLELPPRASSNIRIEVKCTRVDCIAGRCDVVAELTGIPAGRCPSTWSNAGNELFTQS